MALKTKRIGGADLVRQIAPVTVNLPSAMPVAEYSPPEPAVETRADKEKHTIVTVNIPLDLVAAMREAADRRALRLAREHPKGRGGRPSVSAIVVEILQRHRHEIDEY
jgi:hypothetical protein